MTDQEFADVCVSMVKAFISAGCTVKSHSRMVSLHDDTAQFTVNVKLNSQRNMVDCKMCGGKGHNTTTDTGFVKSMVILCRYCAGTGKVREA